MTQDSMINDLTTGSVSRKLMKFAAPFMLSNLLQTLYGLVDMIIIGQFVGSTGLSAVSVGFDLLTLFTYVGMGFTAAGQTMISQYVGMGDRESIRRTIGTMFTVILAGSLVISAFGLIACDLLLDLLNTPAEAMAQAHAYTMVCYSGMFFIFGYNIVSSILRGMGDSKRPLVFVAIAACTNLLLDLLFVVGFKMGAMGAALATVIGQALSFVISLIYLYRRRVAFGFDFKPKSFAVDGAKLKPMLRMGLPLTLQVAAIAISVLVVNSYINAFGVVISAVNGIGLKISSIANVVTTAMGVAGASMIGQNLGAGKYERVPKVISFTLVITCSFAVLLSLVMLLFPEEVFSLWSGEQEVLEMSKVYAPIAVISFFGFALRCPFMALINGLGHAMLGLVVGLLDGVVFRIGLAILLGVTFGMGISGFWYGSVVAGFVPAIIGSIYYIGGRWRTRELLVKK